MATELIAGEIADANQRYFGIAEIKPSPDDKGWGLFASKSFLEGEKVMVGCCMSVQSKPDSHSVQMDRDTHVQMDLPARFVNHQCGVANLGIRTNNIGAYDFYALRNIEEGEELTWDYETSEYELSCSFTCTCGSPVCRKRIRGFRYSGDAVKEAYGEEFIAPHLLMGRPEQ